MRNRWARTSSSEASGSPSWTTATRLVAGHFLAAAVGSVAGLCAVAFGNAVVTVADLLTHRFADPLDRGLPLPFHRLHWQIFLPAVGAILAWVSARWVFSTPERPGMSSVILETRGQPGQLRLRYLPAYFLNGVFTLGFGGSAGQEVPVVTMGSTLGVWVSRKFRITPAEKQALLASGAAAALAAAFSAPLAGVLFAFEVVLGEFSVTLLPAIFLSSVAGGFIASFTEGSKPAEYFRAFAHARVSGLELPLFAFLGVLAAVLGLVFRKALETSEKHLAELPLSPGVRAAIGGFGVGVLGVLVPGILGPGYETTAAACSGYGGWSFLVVLLAAKIGATALTLGSGGWGGDFAPTLFVGAMLGGAYGKGLSAFFGYRVADPGAYAVVGMAAVLAATVRSPLTAVALALELTRSWPLVPPLALAVTVSVLVAKQMSPWGLYERRVLELVKARR